MVSSQPQRIAWQVVTVREVIEETARVHSVVLDAPAWPGHRAGQHVDVRLTAPDGYQAERSYSIASAPEDDALVLTVERIEDGEVSPYLVDVVQQGDAFEIRGPIGGHFVWETSLPGPLVLIGGGSGIVPLRAMLRHRAAQRSDVPARAVYSSRSLDEVIYREELEALAGDPNLNLYLTLTRVQPPDWTGYARRIDRDLLADVVFAADEAPQIYICGPTAFVETAADVCVALGHAPAHIRTERFGPTG
jgi:ferredoxin-NADP reductase